MVNEFNDFKEPQVLYDSNYESLIVKCTVLGKPIENGRYVNFFKKEVFCGDVLVYSEMIPAHSTVLNFGLIEENYFVNLCRSINHGTFRIDPAKTQLPKIPRDVTYADVSIIVSSKLEHFYEKLDKLADKIINPPNNVSQ